MEHQLELSSWSGSEIIWVGNKILESKETLDLNMFIFSQLFFFYFLFQ